MIIQFLGAARTVTGSMHLISVNGTRILLDCGMFQGKRSEAYERNRNFPFNAADIDAVMLSHAHIDHAGNLPNLVKNGFRGPIYATRATRDLCNIMLYDSAYIQERDIEFVNKRHRKKKTSRLFNRCIALWMSRLQCRSSSVSITNNQYR
jgi:metallo-beta-lactamase family protein